MLLSSDAVMHSTPFQAPSYRSVCLYPGTILVAGDQAVGLKQVGHRKYCTRQTLGVSLPVETSLSPLLLRPLIYSYISSLDWGVQMALDMKSGKR
jgi:hypothetical protein